MNRNTFVKVTAIILAAVIALSSASILLNVLFF